MRGRSRRWTPIGCCCFPTAPRTCGVRSTRSWSPWPEDQHRSPSRTSQRSSDPLIIDHEMSIIDLVRRRTQSAMTSTQGGAVAKALAKGSRISGAQRTTLATQYAKRYAGGESIRKIADDAGRSYGFVHNVLKESGVSLRGRGGATRGTAKKTASARAAKKSSTTRTSTATKTAEAPAARTAAKTTTTKKAAA